MVVASKVEMYYSQPGLTLFYRSILPARHAEQAKEKARDKLGLFLKIVTLRGTIWNQLISSIENFAIINSGETAY